MLYSFTRSRKDISPPRRVRISEVKDSSITLTWRTKGDTISGFLIEATPTTTSPSNIPIQRTIGPESRTYVLTGRQVSQITRMKKASSFGFRLTLITCLFPLVGLEPGTTYKVNLYTLKGNGRSIPFTLTATTGNQSPVMYYTKEIFRIRFFLLWLHSETLLLL